MQIMQSACIGCSAQGARSLSIVTELSARFAVAYRLESCRNRQQRKLSSQRPPAFCSNRPLPDKVRTQGAP